VIVPTSDYKIRSVRPPVLADDLGVLWTPFEIWHEAISHFSAATKH